MKKYVKFLSLFMAAVMIITAALPAVGIETAAVVEAASKSYKETYAGSGIFSNGKYQYYTEHDSNYNYYLYKKNLSTGETAKLKKFTMTGDSSDPDTYCVSAVMNGNIYITRSSFSSWKYWTYVYNLKKGKVIKKVANAQITETSGKYAIVNQGYSTDVSPTKHSIYKLTSGGMKKIKTLGNYIRDAQFINGKIYYSKYPKSSYGSYASMSSIKIYRINKNGKNNKKLASYSSGEEYADIMVTKLTAKYCKIYYYSSSSGKEITKKLTF